MPAVEPAPADLDRLEDLLAGAFEAIVAALDRQQPVVVILADEDIQGNGDPAAAALAHGLLGLVRGLAIEGRKPGWRISALAVTPTVSETEKRRWISFLEGAPDASGSLVRLGGGQLGRLPA